MMVSSSREKSFVQTNLGRTSTLYCFTKILDDQFFRAIDVNAAHLSANARRKIANGLCEGWLKANGKRLGRDYNLDLVNLWRQAGPNQTVYQVHLGIKDNDTALLFKLTWGGNV